MWVVAVKGLIKNIFFNWSRFCFSILIIYHNHLVKFEWVVTTLSIVIFSYNISYLKTILYDR